MALPRVAPDDTEAVDVEVDVRTGAGTGTPTEMEEAPTGAPAGADPVAMSAAPEEDDRISRAAELWRIEGSIGAVRAELGRFESLDDARLRARLRNLERRWRAELETMLSGPVLEELHELLDWADDPAVAASEVRLGLAELAGWLDGLIAGLEVPNVEPGD
ncbi:MAG TPA: proteasome activator [Acidimicrobiales bacterium]|nr:proteasome activator [Acidimicrobiales bacterium]